MANLPFIDNKPQSVQGTETELAKMSSLLRKGHYPGAADRERQIMLNYETAVGQQTCWWLSSGFAELSFSENFSHNIHWTLVLMFP